jgi:hypothetical protein
MTTTRLAPTETASGRARLLHPALALALIAAPVLHVIAGAICPGLKSGTAAQLALVAGHPARWYWYTVVLILGNVLAVPAVIGLMQLGAARMRRVGMVGGVLVTFGFLGAIVDCADQLWTWVIAEHGGDRTRMAALIDRFDNTAGASLPFAITGIALLVGTVLLTVALVRNRAVPTWAAVTFGAAVFVNVVSFSANLFPVVIVSFVLLLAGMGGIGRASLRAAGAPQG